jgi:hypothetical protein
MTRFYEITLTPNGATTPTRTWSSHPSGVFDPNALDVEFDCQVTSFAVAAQIFTVTIHGVSLQDISQAQQFTGMQFSMKGGMKAGLPLANPLQSGDLIKGEVFQAYGNWEGTDMRLDLVIAPSSYTLDNPGNIVLNWPAGQALQQALQNTLSVSYPNVPLSINISNQLVQNFAETHFCSTLQELSQCVGGITQGNFLGSKYSGVFFTAQNGTIFIWDQTYSAKTVPLAFTDFVGQPTWIETNTMMVKLVLRADLQLGTQIKMPQGQQNLPGIVTTTYQSFPSSNNYQTTFQGTFQITELRHIGSYRSTDGASWSTLARCVPVASS